MEIMRAYEHIDAVDLKQLHLVDRPKQLSAAGRLNAFNIEALCRERNPSRQRQAYAFKGHEAALRARPRSQPLGVLRCLLRCLFISNVLTDFLPKILPSLSSALIWRRSFASWRSFFLM